MQRNGVPVFKHIWERAAVKSKKWARKRNNRQVHRDLGPAKAAVTITVTLCA